MSRSASSAAGEPGGIHSRSATASAKPSAAPPGLETAERVPTEPGRGKGLLAGIGAFVIWGTFPLFLKPLHEVTSLQIIAHRVAWSCVLILVWMGLRGDLGKLRALLESPAMLGRLGLSAFLITVNWLVFVWGVGHGHVVDTSLGYFINPLANVLLGIVVLRERLNGAQWVAVAVAAVGVVYLGWIAGSPPWLALTLAASFSLYGLVRKVIQVEALPGLAVETLMLAPIALVYLIWCELHGTGAFGHSSGLVNALLVGCGPMTAVPLFLFAYGARLIPYSTMGLLLYITPSLQLLSGIFLYHESFVPARAIGFALIWLALLIYAGEGLWRAHRPVRIS